MLIEHCSHSRRPLNNFYEHARTGCHRLTQWEPHRTHKTVRTVTGKDAEGQLWATEITNVPGLLSYLRMGNRLPGEPIPS